MIPFDNLILKENVEIIFQLLTFATNCDTI